MPQCTLPYRTEPRMSLRLRPVVARSLNHCDLEELSDGSQQMTRAEFLRFVAYPSRVTIRIGRGRARPATQIAYAYCTKTRLKHAFPLEFPVRLVEIH